MPTDAIKFNADPCTWPDAVFYAYLHACDMLRVLHRAAGRDWGTADETELAAYVATILDSDRADSVKYGNVVIARNDDDEGDGKWSIGLSISYAVASCHFHRESAAENSQCH